MSVSPVADFYQGYEGEPEFLFLVDGDLRVRCWEGHIATLFDDVAPVDGEWTGLAAAHHLDLWGDEPWQVPNLAAAIQQLRTPAPTQMSPHLAKEVEAVCAALLEMLERADVAGSTVVVRRD